MVLDTDMNPPSSKLDRAYARGLERGNALVASGEAGLDGRYWHDAARCLATLLSWPKEKVVAEVLAYHRERLDAVPDLTRYPELRGYRDLLVEEHRGMRDAGADDETISLAATLNFWRDTRLLQQTGRGWHAPVMPEKCRVVYVPETDEGVLHAKNVDDPLTYWKPRPPYPQGAPWPWTHPLMFDGVGSGLHVDEIPPEIFPVGVLELCKEHCTTVDAATDFLARYNYFWSSQNLLIHDQHGNSMAFEKTRCRVATRKPNVKGVNFINGMGALDPGIRDHQRRMRAQYLEQTGQGPDTLESRYFAFCEKKWENMARLVERLPADPGLDDVTSLMEQRDPSGPMCLTGQKVHPDEPAPGCTLVMDVWFMDKKKLHRRQWRGDTPAYLDTPEIVQFR
jgi:hypothetical protein